MSTTNEPYRIEMMQVGILAQETVPSVRMSRARFVEIVEQALEAGEYSREIRDELVPVARTMPRFPLSEWIDKRRGCGCVVGEYLVAHSELDRKALAAKIHKDGLTVTNIDVMLEDNPLRESLLQFGEDIDTAIKHELIHGDLKDLNGESTYAEYVSEVTSYVQSVEIVD